MHEFGAGQFPDGLAFDSEGKVWIAGVISNQLLRMDPETSLLDIVLSETDAEHVAWVERAFRANELGRPHMDSNPAAKLRNLSSIAFGGPDLRDGYLGCLLGDHIARASGHRGCQVAMSERVSERLPDGQAARFYVEVRNEVGKPIYRASLSFQVKNKVDIERKAARPWRPRGEQPPS